MGRYHDKLGFVKPVTEHGRTTMTPFERSYFGEVTQNHFKWQPDANQVNDQIRVNNVISVMCNSFLTENLQYLRYVWYMGVRWSISNIQPAYPRLIINIGGVYNGPAVSDEGSTGSS